MVDYKSMGARIRKKRRERHWTQERLSKEVHLSLSFIGHIERGTRRLSLDSFVALCNLLNVSPNYLLEKSIDITHPFDSLTPQKRSALREFVCHLNDNLDEWLADETDENLKDDDFEDESFEDDFPEETDPVMKRYLEEV